MGTRWPNYLIYSVDKTKQAYIPDIPRLYAGSRDKLFLICSVALLIKNKILPLFNFLGAFNSLPDAGIQRSTRGPLRKNTLARERRDLYEIPATISDAAEIYEKLHEFLSGKAKVWFDILLRLVPQRPKSHQRSG